MHTVFKELIDAQEKVIFKTARRIVGHVTADDLLQPNDFPELELNPYFRYEEGVLAGIRTAYAAFCAQERA